MHTTFFDLEKIIYLGKSEIGQSWRPADSPGAIKPQRKQTKNKRLLPLVRKLDNDNKVYSKQHRNNNKTIRTTMKIHHHIYP
ncbi:hypothetical protein RCL_jg9192.t1 [Rhizophagus clarus]|uniref:Uncharacterized protein n=1 Tax=Rhizophagus clarus TaxID=94130 RepID=A0A8H3M4V4_9GLOM|nr:hypothetical protein RCL_jg9192.t1 [Rhizophagus clarus]